MSKAIKFTTPRVNTNVHYELWVISCVSAGLSLAKNVPFGGVMLVMVVGKEFHM